MAKAHGNHLLRGKIGQFIYRVRDDKQQVYLAPQKTKHKTHAWNYDGANNYRKNIEEFTGAATLGGEIYRNLRRNFDARTFDGKCLGPVFRPYSHNIIVARLKEFAEYGRKCQLRAESGHMLRVYARSFTIRDAERALQGLDLSHDGAPTQHIEMTPIGPHHNPTAIKISGFQAAAAAIPTHGNSRLECRVHILQSEFAEYTLPEGAEQWVRHKNTAPNSSPLHNVSHTYTNECTHWIPVQIIPQEGLTMDLPQWEAHEKHVTAIAIEWREVRTVGRKIKALHKHAVVRIVSLHATAQDFQDPDAALLPTWEAQIDQEKQPDFLEIDWETAPETFLAAALTRIRT